MDGDRIYQFLERWLTKQLKKENFIYLSIVRPILVIHIILLLFFMTFGIRIMSIFNVFSIGFYLICSLCLRYDKEPVFVYYAVYMEVIIHSIIAVVCIGWETGFALYMIGLVPTGYYTCMNRGHNVKQKYIIPTFLGFLCYACYFVCWWIGLHGEPIYNILVLVRVKYVVYIFNTICLFSMLFWSVIAFIIDVNRALGNLERTNEYLMKMAYMDPLTSLYNRRYMMKLFEKAGDNYCVIMCDIDNFKNVNDNYGHDFGDLVLKDTAAIIRKQMKGHGHVCRWGGEEVVILYNGGMKETCRMAEKIRSEIEHHNYSTFYRTIHCSITMGVADHVHDEDAETTIKRADERLYWGKQNGKNRVVEEDH